MEPNCSLGPPGCETKVSLKQFGVGYVKMHGMFIYGFFMILLNF